MSSVFEILESNNPEKIDDLIRKTFDQADANKNGVIEMNELYNFMIFFSNQLNLKLPSEQDVKETMIKYDVNKDNVLQFDEMKPYIM